jgi:hypothetical protein
MTEEEQPKNPRLEALRKLREAASLYDKATDEAEKEGKAVDSTEHQVRMVEALQETIDEFNKGIESLQSLHSSFEKIRKDFKVDKTFDFSKFKDEAPKK